jgi:putative membrane protein
MNRRFMLLAAAAAATAGPALAQTNPTPATPAAPAPSASPAPPTPPDTAAGSPAAVGQAEQNHDNQTAMLGGASLQMANIALQKARHPRVREFAKFEHEEQTTVAAVLKSLDANLAPPAPPQDVAATIDRLKGMRPGAAFDREFVSAQIAGHEKLRAVQQDYLKTGNDVPTVATSKLILGMIEEHLALLSDLRADRLAAL